MTGQRPKGILLDYGGTLLEEAGYDLRAGIEAMLARASYVAPKVTLDLVTERAKRVSSPSSISCYSPLKVCHRTLRLRSARLPRAFRSFTTRP